MKRLSANSCPFFWLHEHSRWVLVTHSPPSHQPSCGIEYRIIKVRARGKKSKSADSRRTEKAFSFCKNVRDFSCHSTSNNSLFSCPIYHQCPTYFLSLCGLKLFHFLSPQNFPHTTQNVGLPKGPDSERERENFLKHEMKSSYTNLFSFSVLSYEIKSTSNEKWH